MKIETKIHPVIDMDRFDICAFPEEFYFRTEIEFQEELIKYLLSKMCIGCHKSMLYVKYTDFVDYIRDITYQIKLCNHYKCDDK
jgi:hypothetical protein